MTSNSSLKFEMQYCIVLVLCILGSVSCNKDETTDFIEPLKNITATLGSNLEFSCSVLHLGSSRIIWFHKPEGHIVDAILAVNGLKVTTNPKISFSVIPRSGDITESILYIFNVAAEEAGVYTCGVNVTPMILNKGILEVTKPKAKEPITKAPVEVTQPSPPVEKQTPSSQIFCFNFPKIWKDTKQEAKKFIKDVWKKISTLF